MIIKSFIAESAGAALKQVRHAMGGDAVVLRTSQVRDPQGKMLIEVTALLDRASVGQTESILAESETERAGEFNYGSVSPNRADSQPGSLPTRGSDRLRNLLAEVDFSQSVSDSLITKETTLVETGTDEGLKKLLVNQIDSQIAPQLTFEAGDRVLIVGPTGAGKTSVMGKLAAKLTIEERKKVKLCSLDNMKVAAAEEILSYADLLGTEVCDADSAEHQGESIMLIDTPAPINDKKKQELLIQKAKALRPTHCLLVVSSLTRSSDLAGMLNTLIAFEPTQLVMTMTDLTWRYGSALAALSQTGTKLAWVTDGPGGIGSLVRPDSSRLVEAMLAGGGDDA